MFNSGLLKAAGKTVNVDDKKNHKYIRTYDRVYRIIFVYCIIMILICNSIFVSGNFCFQRTIVIAVGHVQEVLGN